MTSKDEQNMTACLINKGKKQTQQINQKLYEFNEGC